MELPIVVSPVDTKEYNSHWGKGLSKGNFQTLILRHSDKVQYLGICYTIA